MATPKQPTVSGRGLGWEMRALRERQGLTLRKVAEQLAWPPSKVSRIETGKQGIRTEDVASMLVVYGVTGDEREQLLERTAKADELGFWEIQRGVARESRTLTELEKRATSIFNMEPLWLPGLLQTPDYTRAIMKSGGVTEAQIEERLTGRMGRQAILSRDNPPQLEFAIDEGALRRMVLPPRLLVRQLRQLIETAERPNVMIRVLPLSLGAHTGMDGSFVLLSLANGQSVVHVEHKISWLFLEKEHQVAFYRGEVARLRSVALEADESVQLIATIAKELDDE